MSTFSSQDTEYMRRALTLAARGRGAVAPNPMVGCVIVKDGITVGEGWHQRYGKAHAERNAVDQVPNPAALVGSTVYVTLEPCSHFGNTPPCCDLLIRHRVARVVVSSGDPNPLVDGAGVERMRQAGVQVDVGLLEDQARELNSAFFRRISEGV